MRGSLAEGGCGRDCLLKWCRTDSEGGGGWGFGSVPMELIQHTGGSLCFTDSLELLLNHTKAAGPGALTGGTEVLWF